LIMLQIRQKCARVAAELAGRHLMMI
jgi:hypothetical protein